MQPTSLAAMTRVPGTKGALRIAHSVASLDDLSAGPSYSVPGLARAQAELGARVQIHSLAGDPHHYAERLQDLRHPPDFASFPVLKKVGFSRSMNHALATGHLDVIHTHGLWRMVNSYCRSQTSFVIAPRGMLTPVALEFSPAKKKAFGWLSQNATFQRAAMFHATAESEYNDIRRFGLDRPIAIIPNGINIPNIARPVSTRSRRLISLGRIHPQKGLNILLAAWADLEATFPDWKLEIVGPDQMGHRAELEAFARAHNLQHVRFGDAIHGAEKERFMSSADLFILPSRSENFAMTVAESLAVSVPVIATRGTPWSALETHRCGWWIEQSRAEIASALRHALSLPDEELRKMGANGQAWMRDSFSWERMAKMSLQAYEWLLGLGDLPDHVIIR